LTGSCVSSGCRDEGFLVRIVMLGPPASGKGTQGIRLAEELGLPHVSSGELLRRSMERGDPFGIRDLVAAGRLVPDETVQQLLLSALGQSFILDGYPRTAAQAAWLDEALAERQTLLDAAVEIAADEAELAARMAQRAQVESRPDDRPDAFQRRLEDYRAQSPRLREHYQGRLVIVDGDGTPGAVFERLLDGLRRTGVLGSEVS
jgi:adenylate kinase